MAIPLQLFLDVRLPNNPFTRMPIDGIAPGQRIGDWKTDIGKLLNHPSALELIYLGDVLADDLSLTEHNIRSGGTIHVLQKTPQEIASDRVITPDEIEAACTAYNKLKDFSRASTDALFPEALKLVLAKYPEFHKELGALAILKNKTLLTKLRKKEFADKLAATYPLLIVAAPYIVKTFNETLIKWLKHGKITPLHATEEESDVSMESDDDSPQSENPPAGSASGGTISRNQLADALMMAGSSAARTTGAPTSSTNSRPSTSHSSRSNRITSAAFQSALLNAYRDAAQASSGIQPDGQPPTEPVVDESRVFIEQSRAQYESELQIMHEMGLMNDAQNVQALIVCNGDVERAINLVFASAGGV